MSIDLGDVDIQWEVLLSKQRYNYQKLCIEYKVQALPTKIHLFKAKSFGDDNNRIGNILNDRCMEDLEKVFHNPKLGWDKYCPASKFITINLNGNHNTMMTDPKNRALLGKELTMSLLQKKY